MSKKFTHEDDEELLETTTDDVEEYNEDEIDTDDPVKMSEWVLAILLAFIPIINIVCLCVWAFGPNAKPSKKSWARAKLVWLLVQTVLLTIVAAFFIGYLVSMA